MVTAAGGQKKNKQKHKLAKGIKLHFAFTYLNKYINHGELVFKNIHSLAPFIISIIVDQTTILYKT